MLEKISQSADSAISEKELCLSETQNFDSNSRTTATGFSQETKRTARETCLIYLALFKSLQTSFSGNPSSGSFQDSASDWK